MKSISLLWRWLHWMLTSKMIFMTIISYGINQSNSFIGCPNAHFLQIQLSLSILNVPWCATFYCESGPIDLNLLRLNQNRRALACLSRVRSSNSIFVLKLIYFSSQPHIFTSKIKKMSFFWTPRFDSCIEDAQLIWAKILSLWPNHIAFIFLVKMLSTLSWNFCFSKPSQ